MENIISKFLELEKPSPSNEVMTKAEVKKVKNYYIRTLGDISTSAEAQRIYNPTLPPTKPKGPTAAQMQSGVASALDTQGSWGTSERND